MRKVLLTTLFALALSAPAVGFSGSVTKTGDLDGDSYEEAVYTTQVDLPDVDTAFDPTVIKVYDYCANTGDVVNERISGRQDGVNFLKLRKIDTRRGREVFFDMRSGAAARQGESRVVAWRKHSGATCRKARDLFKYRSTHPTRRPSGTTGEVSGFSVKVGERARRYRGKEVILSELFLRPGEPECCASVKKITYWRYSRKRDKYLRYKTIVKRR